MKRFVGGIAVVALLAGTLAASAEGQIHGNPVYGITPGTGVTINGDFGRGLNDDAYKTNYFGARVIVGTPAASFWAGGGILKNGDSEISFGGGAAVHVLKGPAVPVAVSIQGGIGIISEDFMGTSYTTMNVPVGPVFTFTVPSPTASVQPWVSPRVHLTRWSGGDESDSEIGFGASGGVNVTLPTGFGFHVVLDVMTIGDPSMKPFYAGGGVHYTIEVPSLM